MTALTRVSLLEHLREAEADDIWFDFFSMYGDLIAGWLKAQGLQPQDVDDVRQEVMRAVFEQIKNFHHNGRPGAFRSWLRRITSNRLARHWETKKRVQRDRTGPDLSQIAELLADDRSRLSAEWDRQHNAYVLRQLVKRLDGRFEPKSLAAFRRIAIGEEQAQHVADELGMSIGAVRVAQHRVMRALRQLGEGLID